MALGTTLPSTAIVGAGAAGLSLALMLDGYVRVFESGQVGGLCRSHRREDGFTYDTGPHVLGGIPEAVDWIVKSTGIDFVEGETKNVGWTREIVSHPFVDEAVGERYVEKMWKSPVVLLNKVGLSAQRGRTPGGVQKYRYPSFGGYQAIADAWAEQLEERIEQRRISAGVGLYELSRDFDRIVWTAPIKGLRYNALTLITAGFEGESPNLTAVYCPNKETPFHRISFPSAFSPDNAPDGCWSAQGELSSEGERIFCDHHVDQLITLLNDILGRELTPLWTATDYVFNAYPVPLTSQTLTAEQLTGFDHSRVPIYCHGRTGSHSYLNIDGVVAQSMALAERLNAA